MNRTTLEKYYRTDWFWWVVQRSHLLTIASWTLVAIFLSRIAWYDVRIIYADIGLIYGLFYTYAAILAPFLLMICVGRIDMLRTSRTVLVFASVALYGIILAIIYQSPVSYLLSDSFKFLLVPAGLVAGRLLARRIGVTWVGILVVAFSFLFLILKFVFFVYVNDGVTGLLYGGIADFLPFVIALSVAVFARGRYAAVWFAVFVATALLLIMGQKRTLLILMVFNLSYVLTRFWRRPRVWVMFTVLTTGLIVAGGAFLQLNVGADSRLLNRFVRTDVNTDIGVESRRYREVRLVFEELLERGALAVLLGIGSGATFEEEIPDRRTGITTIHSVHFTPAAMLFRYGGIGIAYYIWFFGFGYRVLRAAERLGGKRAVRGVFVGFRLYWVDAFVASWVIYGFVDDLILGLFLGVALEWLYCCRQESEWRKGAPVPCEAKSINADVC